VITLFIGNQYEIPGSTVTGYYGVSGRLLSDKGTDLLFRTDQIQPLCHVWDTALEYT
jgi:hypothetical protein